MKYYKFSAYGFVRTNIKESELRTVVEKAIKEVPDLRLELSFPIKDHYNQCLRVLNALVDSDLSPVVKKEVVLEITEDLKSLVNNNNIDYIIAKYTEEVPPVSSNYNIIQSFIKKYF